MDNTDKIPVVVNGAAGKMGREVVKAIASAEDMQLIAAVDRNPEVMGLDVGEVAGRGALEVPIVNDLEASLVMATQDKIQGEIGRASCRERVYLCV